MGSHWENVYMIVHIKIMTFCDVWEPPAKCQESGGGLITFLLSSADATVEELPGRRFYFICIEFRDMEDAKCGCLYRYVRRHPTFGEPGTGLPGLAVL
jgi:hypothetical protein